MIAIPNRREHDSYDVDAGKLGHFTLRFGRLPVTDQCIEVFFDQRGKVGHEINELLELLGITISKVLQGKPVA